MILKQSFYDIDCVNRKYLLQDQLEIAICRLNEELYRVNPVEEECPKYACSKCLTILSLGPLFRKKFIIQIRISSLILQHRNSCLSW